MAEKPVLANCWEYMHCGRDPGGSDSVELGVCPAAMDQSADGLNGGKNAGRICWAVAGTLCGGKVHGTYAEKRLFCRTCDFFKQVENAQGAGFVLLNYKTGVRRP